jgi:hypothetical protein
MSFLSPWFLAGLAAVALPLWLHLLERQNPVRVPFSSLMFFQRRTERSVRHRRLRYLLLLGSRLALLAVLAFLFARPVIYRAVGGSFQPSRNHIIAIDTSFSMGYGDRWTRAQSEALAVVNQIRSGDRAQVIAFGPGVQMLGEPGYDREALRAAIQSLKPTSSRNSYGELGQSLRALAENASLPSVVHVISDFQRSAMPGRFADLSMPATATLNIHNVAQADDRNWSVESVRGDSRLYQNARARIEATVAGFQTPAATRRVSLLVNGRTIATQSVAVPESGRATVQFTDFEVPHGHSRAEVRIDAADSLPGDDVRLFSFDKSDPSPILFVHQPGRSREVLYYRTALDAAGPSMFTLQAVTPAETGNLALERFAFVVISDVARLPGSFEQRLKSYLEAGGAALLVMGPAIALEGGAPLISGRISDARYTGREAARFQQVGQIDLAHPALRGSRRFSGVKFFRFVRWETTSDRIAARLSDGSPLLIEEARGAGRLLVLASALDNLWNDLPVHPVFVPFVTESARYLSGVEELVTQATVDSVLQLQRRRDPRATVEVLDPAGRRALDLAAAATNPEVVLTSTGFWEVRRAGENSLVAVNPDPRESDLRPMEEDVLALWKSTGEPEAAGTAAGAAPQSAPRDLWRLVLFLVLLAAVIESVLANLHLGVQREVGSE